MKQPELGRKIAELRKSKGLTQEELVSKCNLNVRTLQRIESGLVIPRSYTIRIIFAALDYNFNDSSEKFLRDSFKSFFQNKIEQINSWLVDLFNLKPNTIKKLLILSATVIVLSFAVFILFSVRIGQGSNENKFVTSNGRGIVYLFPRGLNIQISNTKDTADYQFGKYLIQEYKNNIFLNKKFVGKTIDDDTVVLKKGQVKIRTSYWKFLSPNNKGIIYLFPKTRTLNYSAQKDTDNMLIGALHIKEFNNKIFLNNNYKGYAYTNDTVILKKGLLTILNKNSRINVNVNSNFEIMIVLFNLSKSGSWVYTTPFSPYYINKQMKYFDNYKSHNAVVFTDAFINKGYWLPAMLDIAANCTELPNSKLIDKLPDSFYSDLSKKLPHKLVDSLNARLIYLVNQFYVDTKFEQFLQSNRKCYEKIIKEINDSLKTYDFISELELFYNSKFYSYNLNPSPLLNGLAFGVTKYSSNQEICYNVFPPYDKPVVDSTNGEFSYMGFGNRRRLIDLAIHEWGHSFVNPITDKFEKEINESSYLYNSIMGKMKTQGYTTWKICIREHLVRLGEIIILNEIGQTGLSTEIKNEYINNKKFIYLPFLLKEFEKYDPQSGSYEVFLLSILNKMKENKFPL
jgi:transcriptional regulator with XRE-family HTH domain